ncbi:MAG: TIGR03667 family PPOX class F420-dependent oxidoreductase [Ktedonobacteraceae bacterium]|nr:TIGR03667 family PPOX class F420-dependent oxidoreductase [Ktedonobacteraceae bacterium]
MASFLDLTKERDAHIEERMRNDHMTWLITTRPDGRPHAVAVWFLWDGDTILIFSRPNNQKIRNIQANPNVLLAIDDTRQGDDPITIEGTATLLAIGDVDTSLAAYLEKYGEGIKEIGLTPEQMAAQYSQAIKIQPTRAM